MPHEGIPQTRGVTGGPRKGSTQWDGTGGALVGTRASSSSSDNHYSHSSASISSSRLSKSCWRRGCHGTCTDFLRSGERERERERVPEQSSFPIWLRLWHLGQLQALQVGSRLGLWLGSGTLRDVMLAIPIAQQKDIHGPNLFRVPCYEVHRAMATRCGLGSFRWTRPPRLTKDWSRSQARQAE